MTELKVGLVLYPKFTALDIVGPFQTLVDVPGVDAFFVAKQAGPVVDHTGRLTLTATMAFDDVDSLDALSCQGDLQTATSSPAMTSLNSSNESTRPHNGQRASVRVRSTLRMRDSWRGPPPRATGPRTHDSLHSVRYLQRHAWWK